MEVPGDDAFPNCDIRKNDGSGVKGPATCNRAYAVILSLPCRGHSAIAACGCSSLLQELAPLVFDAYACFIHTGVERPSEVWMSAETGAQLRRHDSQGLGILGMDGFETCGSDVEEVKREKFDELVMACGEFCDRLFYALDVQADLFIHRRRYGSETSGQTSNLA